MALRATLFVLLAATAAAFAQVPGGPGEAPPPPRYGVDASPQIYPQLTPRDTLASAIKAVEKQEYAYLAAHLLDPKYVDDRVEARRRDIETAVDKELRLARDRQQRETGTARDALPLDPAAFAALVDAEARRRAFAQLVDEIRAHLEESATTAAEFRRFLRAGAPQEAGETATATLKDAPKAGAREARGADDTRQMFFRKLDTRWYVENRQTAAPEAAKQ